MQLRQPIVVVLGHVDVGKTTLLDLIRGTYVASREAGGITQHIGASLFPVDSLIDTCKQFVKELDIKLKVPGLLVIDTPGHQAFVNLRSRGGSIADVAILVVDVMKGAQEQTRESIQILKARRTPFVVAANKIDTISGWKPSQMSTFAETYEKQAPDVKEALVNMVYQLMGDLSFLGFESDLYNKITSFEKTVAIVPVSAATGEGVPDLLIVLLGLTEKFLQEKLAAAGAAARGVVLEVVEEEGLGTTVNAVVYAGELKSGDRIALTGREAPFMTKIRSILLPRPLDEIRDPRDRFKAVDSVAAVAGVKVVAADLEKAVPGSPILVPEKDENEDEVLSRISEDVAEVTIRTDRVGVVLKADTLGSLEVATQMLKDRGIPVRFADIGDLSRRDVVEADVVRQKEKLSGVVLAFNVRASPSVEMEAENLGIPIFKGDVLFRVIGDYATWAEERRVAEEKAAYEKLVKPGKMKVLEGFLFRRTAPAIFGVEILSGRIKPKYLMTNQAGKTVGSISQIQDKGESVGEAKKGEKVAVSMRNVVFGRHVRENQVLLVAVPEDQARELTKSYIHLLEEDEKKALEELIELRRKSDPFWAR